MRYMFYKNRIRYTSFYNFWLVWKFLDFKRKSQFFILLILMLLSSLAEVLSIAAVIPFLDFLTNKEKIYQNTIVQNLFLNNSINNSTIIFTGLSLIFIFAIFFSGLLRIFNLYYSGKYTAIIGHQISRECYRRSLLQELEIHINRNSSVLISSITRHIDKTISLLNSLLLFIISSLNILFIYVGILVFDFELAITTALGFVAIYGIIVLFTGKRLRRNSLKVAECSTQQYKELQEGFGSYREILLENNQDLHLNRYSLVDFNMRKFSAQSLFLRSFPRYALESLAICLLILLGLIFSLQRGQSSDLISSLGVLALASQRLLPAAQNMYQAWAAIKSTSAEFDDVINLLNQKIFSTSNNAYPLKKFKEISFNNVSFAYKENDFEIIKNLKISIKNGDKIGIKGVTGSGKSTFIDLFMGLLKPSKGKIVLDHLDINNELNINTLIKWRKSIAHVPQKIFLADTTIEQNIAFGVPSEMINPDFVRLCAKNAHADKFIENLKYGYKTKIGEMGVRLSGGQQQRIGIARALYKNTNILVLDEATSALDYDTEKKVIESIYKNYEGKTVLAIAHRTSTLENFDRVIDFTKDGITFN